MAGPQGRLSKTCGSVRQPGLESVLLKVGATNCYQSKKNISVFRNFQSQDVATTFSPTVFHFTQLLELKTSNSKKSPLAIYRDGPRKLT